MTTAMMPTWLRIRGCRPRRTWRRRCRSSLAPRPSPRLLSACGNACRTENLTHPSGLRNALRSCCRSCPRSHFRWIGCLGRHQDRMSAFRDSQSGSRGPRQGLFQNPARRPPDSEVAGTPRNHRHRRGVHNWSAADADGSFKGPVPGASTQCPASLPTAWRKTLTHHGRHRDVSDAFSTDPAAEAAAANELCGAGSANGIGRIVAIRPGTHDWPLAANPLATLAPSMARSLGISGARND